MPDANTTSLPDIALDVFFAYSHKDEALRDELDKHLSMLKRSGKISAWHDRRILGGKEWESEIDEHLKTADIILLLVSPDFMASDYCYKKEMTHAIERHRKGEARVIPVMLRPCDWQDAPFAGLQGFPKDMEPVTRWASRDEAFRDVAVGIRMVVQSLWSRRYQELQQARTPRGPTTEVLVSETTQQVLRKDVSPPRFFPRALSRGELPPSVRPAERKSLQERVNTFVEWLFRDYKPTPPRGHKVFNDALLGNLFFARHEVAVIDCPVLQRLRRIKQTGLVHYVYPSATHTRFEHSLGAAALSERCFDAILENGTLPDVDANRTCGDLAHLRMAALLHDIGHGLCSHASEQIYALLSDLQEFKLNPTYVTNAPGEILSYLIVKSKTFEKWFMEYVVGRCGADLKLDTISKLILGKHDDPDKHFLANIISSAYDCDKLDYIARDSYYCGLALTVDLPRFYSMISTAKYKGHRVLVLRNYVPLEQILFSKMTLFGSVYHHQKVKCLDSMLRSMIGHIVENPGQASFPLRGGNPISFTDPVEYLYVTDDEFFGQADGFGDPYTRGMLARLRNRDLFVRCLQISRRTVKNWDDGRQTLIDLTKLPYELAEVETEIHKCLPAAVQGECNKHDMRLSIPGLPPITRNALIQTSERSAIEYVEGYFPVKQWTDAYAHNKWRSYVYAPREIAKGVRDAAIAVLQDRLKLDIDVNESNQACHFP